MAHVVATVRRAMNWHAPRISARTGGEVEPEWRAAHGVTRMLGMLLIASAFFWALLIGGIVIYLVR